MSPRGPIVTFFVYSLCGDPRYNDKEYKNINGIIINEREHKLSQYADDTLFFFDGTSKSLNETLNVLSEFSNFSGL